MILRKNSSSRLKKLSVIFSCCFFGFQVLKPVICNEVSFWMFSSFFKYIYALISKQDQICSARINVNVWDFWFHFIKEEFWKEGSRSNNTQHLCAVFFQRLFLLLFIIFKKNSRWWWSDLYFFDWKLHGYLHVPIPPPLPSSLNCDLGWWKNWRLLHRKESGIILLSFVYALVTMRKDNASRVSNNW